MLALSNIFSKSINNAKHAIKQMMNLDPLNFSPVANYEIS